MTSAVAPGDEPGASAVSGQDDVADLDALRAVRLEGVGSRRVKLGGKVWALVAEVPFEFAELYRAGRRRDAMSVLLADPSEADAFMALRPSNEDFSALLDTFQTTPGKSSAS